MKMVLCLFFVFMSFCTMSCIRGEGCMKGVLGEELPDDDEMLYGFIAKTSAVMGKKYGLSLTGIGGGGKEGEIRLMIAKFGRYGPPLTEQEARALIVTCVNDFLQAANSDSQLRPYLKCYPFTIQHLRLSIVNRYRDGKDVFDPYITTVSANEGELGYFTEDSLNEYGYKSEKYETYDEAVAILAGEKQKAAADAKPLP